MKIKSLNLMHPFHRVHDLKAIEILWYKSWQLNHIISVTAWHIGSHPNRNPSQPDCLIRWITDILVHNWLAIFCINIIIAKPHSLCCWSNYVSGV